MNLLNLKRLLMMVGVLVGLAACNATTSDQSPLRESYSGEDFFGASVSSREGVASSTCESQFQSQRQNYLSAIESVISRANGTSSVSSAPLERFRGEVNASYNALVSRCKTHMHCLEYHRYDEARCYISASDRKDSERRFADLSTRLREIERDFDVKLAEAQAEGPSANVTVQNSLRTMQSTRQSTQTGDRVLDKEVMIMCSRSENFLDARCRQRCSRQKC